MVESGRDPEVAAPTLAATGSGSYIKKKKEKKNLGSWPVEFIGRLLLFRLLTCMFSKTASDNTIHISVQCFPLGWEALLPFLLPGGANASEKQRPSHHMTINPSVKVFCRSRRHCSGRRRKKSHCVIPLYR